MSRTAVILAAGESTRLPNKLMLPRHDSGVVLEYALEYAAAHCDEVCLVANPHDSPLWTYAQRWPVTRVAQTTPRGVVDAIRIGANWARTKSILVLFGDNVYHLDEVPPPEGGHATVRYFPNRHDLDGWDGQWVDRKADVDLRLAGSIMLDRDSAVAMPDGSLVDALNAMRISPCQRDTNWQDLGTLSEYTRYLCES
jgi:hypothetical protein